MCIFYCKWIGTFFVPPLHNNSSSLISCMAMGGFKNSLNPTLVKFITLFLLIEDELEEEGLVWSFLNRELETNPSKYWNLFFVWLFDVNNEMLKEYGGEPPWFLWFINSHSNKPLRLHLCFWQKVLCYWLLYGRDSSKEMKGCILSTSIPILLSMKQCLKALCFMAAISPAR